MTKRYGKTKRGFTLMELLIVVAIIVILVAISIPIFTKQLEKSREATDVANMRAAKAAAVTAYLTDDTTLGLGEGQTEAVSVYYDADKGVLASTAPTVKYGKGTATDAGISSFMGYTGTTPAKDKVIKVTVATDGGITEAWE